MNSGNAFSLSNEKKNLCAYYFPALKFNFLGFTAQKKSQARNIAFSHIKSAYSLAKQKDYGKHVDKVGFRVMDPTNWRTPLGDVQTQRCSRRIRTWCSKLRFTIDVGVRNPFMWHSTIYCLYNLFEKINTLLQWIFSH